MLQRSIRHGGRKILASATGGLDTRKLLAALDAFRKGDLSARLPEEWTGVAGEIADAFNRTVEQHGAARERASDVEDRVLAALSHELRSPLTPILGWTTLLRSGQLAALDTERALEVIERNARLQARLIDDLLDVSRILSGRLRMDLQPIDLRAAAEAGLAAVAPVAEQRGVALDVELGRDPVPVQGDQERLQRVVWNLATNAVKFSPQGGRVRVELARTAAGALLLLCDEGVGISAEFMPHVFDRFRQAASGTRSAQGGLGLGLTIVKHVVEAHGGTVTAASDGPGRGACFSVVLPLALDADLGRPRQTGPRAVAEPGGAVLAGRAILLVDDEADGREALRGVLEAQGARVWGVGSVAEAVARLEAERPDLVVSDIAMPVADGYALVERLRALRPGVPAIALSAHAAPGESSRARAAGFSVQLTKPVDAALLVETLAGLLAPES